MFITYLITRAAETTNGVIFHSQCKRSQPTTSYL